MKAVRVLRDFVRNYVGLWKKERKRADAFLQAAVNSLSIPKKPTSPKNNRPCGERHRPGNSIEDGSTIPCQFHRTITKKGTDPSGIPDIVRKDVLEGYLTAIAQASDYIYVENQYFREKEVADALIRQHKTKPDLRTIIVIPKVIEEFLKSKGDELSKHGAALQFELFESMKKAIGANLDCSRWSARTTS